MNNWWENTSHNSPWHPPSNPFGSPAAPPPNPFGNSAPVHGGFVTGDQISRNVGAGQQWATNNAPSVINTAHALLECDRRNAQAYAGCNDAMKLGARSEAFSGAAYGMPAGKLGVGMGTLIGASVGASKARLSDPACRGLWSNDMACRKEARENPPSAYFPGRNKR
jgi:hypothetical protein